MQIDATEEEKGKYESKITSPTPSNKSVVNVE